MKFHFHERKFRVRRSAARWIPLDAILFAARIRALIRDSFDFSSFFNPTNFLRFSRVALTRRRKVINRHSIYYRSISYYYTGNSIREHCVVSINENYCNSRTLEWNWLPTSDLISLSIELTILKDRDRPINCLTRASPLSFLFGQKAKS